MDKKSIAWMAAIVITIALVIFYVYSQFTINFGFLGAIVLAAIILLPAFYHYTCAKDVKDYSNGKTQALYIGIFDNRFGCLGAILLLVLGGACIKTLNNYFDADKDVYRNVDHHAVHFSGVRISQPNGFVLAANSNNAFFDDECMAGQATIVGTNDTAVSVRLTGFTRPIYFNHINEEKHRCYRRDLINKESLVSFREGEHLFLRVSDGGIYDFSIGEVTKDSVEYNLRLPNGTTVRSDEDRFLIQGLPLKKLMSHPLIQETNFAGIHIVRDVIRPLVKQKDKLEAYKDTRYCVEIQHTNHYPNEQSVEAIKVGENGQWRSVTSNTDTIIQIPYDAVFTIGYGSRSSRPAYFSRNNQQSGGSLALLFHLPVYHYLQQMPGKSLNNTCVTTSLSSFMDDASIVPENVLLFDVFSHTDNINNIAPIKVSYVSGETNQLLDFLCATANSGMDTIHAGECFVHTHAINHNGVSWIAGVENLKETSPYQPHPIKWHIILFTIALSLLLFIGSHSVENEQSALWNTFTTIEFVAYAVTLFLVTFRWFLLWRTSVFLPVENISYYEFHGVFRNMDNRSKLQLVMILFIVVILFAKLVIRYCPRLTNWSLTENWLTKKSWLLPLLVIFASLVVFVVCGRLRYVSPWLVITLPVLLYLFNSVFIIKKYACFYRLDDRKWEKITIHDYPVKLLGWSVVNAFCTTGILLFIDSGFGILFFTFTLFWLSWLLHEHVTHYLPENRRLVLWRNSCVLIIFLIMLVFICFYKNVIGLMFYTPSVAAISLAVAGCLLCFGVFYILDWKYKRTVAACCLGTALLFACIPFGFKAYVSDQSKHTASRIAVHFERPEDVMKEIRNDREEMRFFNAAQNHMIIEEYNRRGEQVSLFGDHGHGYFKMQPQSRVGALWNAQLTDISLARFVVAEHSAWLPYLFICFFIFMLVWAVRQPLYQRWTRAVLIQIPLLLFVQSLLIWMANTQRFIFLGQDFPMVSINSRLTIIYYFSLLIIWVIIAIYSKVTFTEVYDNDFNDDSGDDVLPMRNSFRYETARKDMIKILFILLLCMCMGYLAPKGKSIRTLKLESLMSDFSQKVEQINFELKDFQEENYQAANRHYGGSMSNLKPFMQEFYNEKRSQIDTLLSDFPFGQLLWKAYIDEGCSTNNTRQALYACLDQGVVQLRNVNVFSYNELPQPNEDEWRGSIVAVSDTATISSNRLVEGELRAYRLPAEWLSDGEEKTIVSCIGAPIYGTEPDFVMQRGIRNSAIIGPGVSLGASYRQALRPVIQEKYYLAHNIMLNGRRTMLYPLGESLYWMRNFARELQAQKNKVKDSERDEKYNCDVELTLVPDLNRNVYNILRQEGANASSSVIVANGDGEVWAMPSFNRRHQLNPNDGRQIANIVDSLELYGLMGSSFARRLFGNQNLLHLPSGPGSSQKPLVWTAVASKVEYNNWAGLRIEPYRNGWIESSNGKFRITHYNGLRFQYRVFAPLTSPDERNGNTITLRDYMTYSSNVYNALMIYIGSFPYSYLVGNPNSLGISPTHNGETLFSNIDVALNRDNYINRFPLLSVNGGNPFTLNNDNIPFNDQSNSILNLSMFEMFFRGQDEDGTSYSNPAYGLLSKDAISYPYSFMERSKFDSRQGAQDDFMEKGIRSTAIGAENVWYVTPWKMAEAFGRMASLNYNLHLNVAKQPTRLPYQQFKNLTNGYWTARGEQLKGMSDVLTSGTASGVGGRLRISSGGLHASNRVGNYYIYAKTGTIGDNDEHRLGVIISNTDLMTANEADLEHARYVMLYFAFSDNRHTNAYASVIQCVMNSPEFIQYMGQHN